MTDLSPAAQAVMDASSTIAAAALRAAADHVEHDWDGFECADYLCSLAAELEALPDD